MSGKIARRLLLGALPLLCAGCGDTPLANVPRLFGAYFKEGADLPLTRAQVAKIPYASIAVRLGRGPQALLILGESSGHKLDWISSSRQVIVTRYGRVVETSGLPIDLTATEFLTPDPLGVPLRPGAVSPCFRTLDLEPGNWAGVPVHSQFRHGGAATLTILGASLATEIWDEHGRVPELDWEFTNRYWVDRQSGFVWQSRQQTAPNLPALEITVFRRALEKAA